MVEPLHKTMLYRNTVYCCFVQWQVFEIMQGGKGEA